MFAGDGSQSVRSATGSTPLTGGASWTGWLVAAMSATVVVYCADLLFQVLPTQVSDPFQQFAACWVFFGAAALCAVKGRAAGPHRSAWLLFALAMTLWGVGALYFAVVLWNSAAVPYPSVSDGFWLVFYLPACAGLCHLLRKQAPVGRGVWLDVLVGGLGVGGAGAALVFQEFLDSAHATAAATATNLAYPIGDLLLLVLVVAGITISGWRAAGAWRWIAAACAIFAVTNSGYLVQVAAGTYDGGLVDLGWPAAALIVGVAAWRPESGMRPARRTEPMIALPALFALAALVLLVADHFVRTNPLALGLAAASLLVMLARLYVTVQDNARMLAQSRREAATDALTGLGNRRQLSNDLATQLDTLEPERPLMLTLFDLDGFKQYNDTFGHLAGDQLLERLSARLSQLLDGRGTAYRMGGDEFCALWNLSDGDHASVTTIEAMAALSEQGEAFSIGCSYGSVLLPNEAADQTEALRIADRRMYLHKNGGPESAGRQSSDVLLRALAECDSDLGIHVDGVADLAMATALWLGLPEEEMEALRQTALLHDIGKVAIPDKILHKPGPLDKSEWAFMKRHTIIGERIILAAPALGRVARFVRSTHERYDGHGYPDGLAGHDIPLIARIVAVCDAYNAMVTTRAYRAAHDRSWAIAELRQCSGTQFDPAVVEAFVSATGPLGERERIKSPSIVRPAG